MNTKINYLYRDAHNYKMWNEYVVKGVLTEEQQKLIIDSLHEGEYFIPRKVGLPEGRFDKWNSADHIWFEMSGDAFEITDKPASIAITTDELVKAFINCKGKWEEDIISSIEAAKSSVDKYQWTITDPDCLQVRRLADYGNQSVFELAQVDTFDLYDKTIYKIAHGDVDLSEYTDKEIKVFLNMYGYSNMEELENLVGSKLEAKGQLAEMIFEIYNTDYHVDQCTNWNEAVNIIEKYTEQDLCEFKKEKQQKQMEDFDYLSTFIYKEDELSKDEERFILGMMSSDGATFYISEKYGDLIRGSEMTVNSAVNVKGMNDYYIFGDYAENGLFLIYDENGQIGKEELKSLFDKNPVYISEKMKSKLDDIRIKEGLEKDSLSDIVKSASEKKNVICYKDDKNRGTDFSL